MKFGIINRWTKNFQFTADIECADDAPISEKMGRSVTWAIKNDANLYDADLYGADLRDADLRDADLGGADMKRLAELEAGRQ